MSALPYILVFVGGGLGSVARFGMGRALSQWSPLSGQTHWATWVINLLASLALVLVFRHLGDRQNLLFLLAAGFCGGWSTFSTFSFEVATLVQSGRTAEALIYLASSLVIVGGIVWMVALAQKV